MRKATLKNVAIAQPEVNDPVRAVNKLNGFKDIVKEEVDAVIWNREIPHPVSSALRSLPSHEVENGRFRIPIDEVGQMVTSLFQNWGWRAGGAHQWIARDSEALASQMGHILSISHVLLRVELIRDDACRKFHRDTVTARLICTYSGPGTELGIADDNNDPHFIDNVPTGCPILLKGKLWPGDGRTKVFHRSPPIEGTGSSRLVVVLNDAAS